MNTKSSLGDTALHWAARGGHASTVDGLIKKGFLLSSLFDNEIK